MPPLPPNEAERLAALRDLRILDTSPEAHFDAVCKSAAAMFSVPIAVVTLIDSDRQWFKAKCGIDAEGTGRDVAFCSYAILSDDVLVVEDATRGSCPSMRWKFGVELEQPSVRQPVVEWP